MLRINLLGTPEIYQDDQLTLRFRTRKAQALLIYLAVTERAWNRDSLAALFWPETDDTTARKNLRDILPTLRRQLSDYLLTKDENIGLDPSSQYKCDVTRFSAVLERELPKVETDTLAATLALYRGDFLEGYVTSRISADFELWALRERERLHQLALIGFTTLCRRQQEIGDYAAALTTNRQLLKLAPWDEAAHRQQMVMLTQSGQQAAALAHYESCRQILAEELDVEPDAETTALYQQIRRGEHNAHSVTNSWSAVSVIRNGDESQDHSRRNDSAPTIPHNLPATLLKLIGYTDEFAYIQTQLVKTECRLLTITGVGGVGKTHLALAAARYIVRSAAADHRFADGVYFVSLDGIQASPSSELVEAAITSAIGEVLGYTFSGGASPQSQLQKRLENRRVLLILDNMEHLLSGDVLIAALLQQTAHLSILATSRERLNLQGEHLLKLTGLLSQPSHTPTNSSPKAPDMSANKIIGNNGIAVSGSETASHEIENSAVALFVYQAQLIDHHFKINRANIAHAERICALVDGLPLGIEMAAKWVESLDLAMIAQEIAQGLDFLEATNRDMPQRHGALRTVFDYSWVLLSVSEQTLLAKLTIFQPGFSSAAAISVTGASLHDLSHLVNKSLLRRNADSQFAMHRSIRHFAREKLDQRPDEQRNTEQRFASFYLSYLVRVQRDVSLSEPMQGESAALGDFDNIKSALRLAVDRDMWPEFRRTTLVIMEIYDTHGWYLECIQLCESAIERLAVSAHSESLEEQILRNALLGQLIALQGWYTLRKGQFTAALALLQRSLAILRQVKAKLSSAIAGIDAGSIDYVTQALGQCLGFFGWLEYFRGELEHALELMKESAPPERQDRGVAGSFIGLARITLQLGMYPEAQIYAQEAMRLAREHGVQYYFLYSMTELGRVQQARGDYAAAEAIFLDCYARRLQVDDQSGLTTCLLSLGEIARLRNDFRASKSYLEHGLQLATETDYFALPMIQWGLGNLALQQKDYVTAKQHFLASMSYPGFTHLSLFGLPTCGWVHVMLAEYEEAERYFHQVVEETRLAKAYGLLMEALSGLIFLLALAEALESPEQYVVLIENYPATTKETKDRIRTMYSQMTSALSGAKSGARHKPYFPSPNLRQTVDKILAELKSIPTTHNLFGEYFGASGDCGVVASEK